MQTTLKNSSEGIKTTTKKEKEEAVHLVHHHRSLINLSVVIFSIFSMFT